MADWGDLAENVARLVDLLDFYISHQYAQWTADPEEVEAARRSRRKPPPFPLIRPVAARPRSLHDRMTQIHTAQAAEYLVDPLAPRMVTDDEFDAFIDQYL